MEQGCTGEQREYTAEPPFFQPGRVEAAQQRHVHVPTDSIGSEVSVDGALIVRLPPPRPRDP
jgi:hypothetical protein